jgi:hypothetical protein
MTDEMRARVARLREDGNAAIRDGDRYAATNAADLLAVCTALEQADTDATEYVKEIRDLTIRCQQAEVDRANCKSQWDAWQSTAYQHVETIQRLEADRTKRICGCESRTGWTAIKCCNVCGLPLPSEPWRFPIATATTATASDRSQRDAAVLRWAAKELCTSDDYGNLEVDDKKLIAMAVAIERGEVVIP